MDRKKIAEKLIAMRGEKTQAEVAKSIGISKSSLAMDETGQRVPRDEIKLAAERTKQHNGTGDSGNGQVCW